MALAMVAPLFLISGSCGYVYPPVEVSQIVASSPHFAPLFLEDEAGSVASQSKITGTLDDPVVDLDLNNEAVLQEKFEEFKAKFAKTYSSHEEEDYRFHVFCKNLKKLQRMNDMEDDTARYGITRFADLTTEEMWRHTGFVPEGYEI